MTTEQLLAGYKALCTDRENSLRYQRKELVAILALLDTGRIADARDRIEDALKNVDACALGDDVGEAA